MYLHTAPRLAAEAPGCAQEQLDRLARSVEARRQQLEEDINAYIARKQDELRAYESELVEQLCSMDRAEHHDQNQGQDHDHDQKHDHDDQLSEAGSSRRSSASAASTERTEDVAAHAAPAEPHRKQKKHGRVHKREKELYGLVTPVFLPLLDARETTTTTPSPEHKDARPPLPTDTSTSSGASTHSPAPSTPASNAPASRAPPQETPPPPGAMPGETPMAPPAVKERSASDPGKKSRRSSIKKKSALRHNSSTPRNRKRVSLVIDDQVVLPSDMIQEPPLTSPGSETTSATNSTASLDDMIDPRLTSDGPVYIEHSDAVHHSLPLTMTAPKTSPIKSTAPPFSTPAPIVTEAAHSPPKSPIPRSPSTAFAPPSYATRSFLDPPPERMHIEDIPPTAGPEAIYPSTDDPEDQLASQDVAPDENFDTYVGGISGSGVADVNQMGSVGYPSSLGASYLESYMQGRPLSVRMAAAEREGDSSELSRLRGLEERRRKKERESEEVKARERGIEEDDEWERSAKGGEKGSRDDEDDEWERSAKGGEKGSRDDEDDFMGSMDDF